MYDQLCTIHNNKTLNSPAIIRWRSESSPWQANQRESPNSSNEVSYQDVGVDVLDNEVAYVSHGAFLTVREVASAHRFVGCRLGMFDGQQRGVLDDRIEVTR